MEDINAIKSMCGCFEVSFNFIETFTYPKDTIEFYKSKEKHDTALEWVQLADEKDNKLVLQHILVFGNGKVLKHWRQDWLYENNDFHLYNGFNDWIYANKKKDEVKGQWTQTVYEVSDQPRYTGSSTWIHKDGRHFWENTSYAPLPRREYTKRSDYNILLRTNVHEIKDYGWVHDQDNKKVIRDEDGQDYVIAEEKGYNSYTRVDDSRCEGAINYWKEYAGMWARVRNTWDKELIKKEYLKLHGKVNGKPLHKLLYPLDPSTSQDSINTIISSYIYTK